MATWDPKKGVLYHEFNKFNKERSLREVDKPNLLRNIFPYSEVPKVDFDFAMNPINPARNFLMTDTTFRDGQQARPPFSVEQISRLFDFLHRMSGPRGIIRQSEFFLYTKKDREAVERCQAKNYQYPMITGWIRAQKKDLTNVRAVGLTETGILTSVSDYHIFLKMGLDRKKAFDKYTDMVRATLEKGIVPRCHFEDVTRADIYGFCVPLAQKLMEIREQSGTDIRIRLCDTMGFGVTYPGAALPRSVPKLIRAFIDDANVPEDLLEWHGHNDFHKGLVNAVFAWLYGCSSVNGTLLGIGERTGNTPLEALMIEYMSLRGMSDGLDTLAITEMAEYFQKELGHPIPDNYPLLGKAFNATSAGVHADGVLKNEEIYNIFDTTKILGRPPVVNITDKSGLAGIAHWVNSKIESEERVDKSHPAISKIYDIIIEQYDKGRVTAMSDKEMMALVKRYLPELFISDWDRMKLIGREMAFKIVERFVETAEMQSGVSKTMETAMMHFLKRYPFIQYCYVADMEGKKITENITDITERAKYMEFKDKEDFSDRPWFIKPVKDGKIHVVGPFTSRITGALCITVSALIRDKKEKMIGVFGADIRLEELIKVENELMEEHGMEFTEKDIRELTRKYRNE
ncbi:triose-phosphate isomerase [Desulfomonile tiedjei]|uniref:Isopropylmalate/homocitrate/citramalate synthase n=1 Tax=Desulfomonile tiedjei (strain ATCC 49306 / DSM 6799 / DCB-1) TaxID=706587 RepID=I4C330_DESTA|nr:cache domain-containing protein [Desulfomonile tiedjei]AFM23971.1 isopropylmalate/homocitrate/citramalate synthase [Desulfomonile tiedjei DSM 6799]